MTLGQFIAALETLDPALVILANGLNPYAGRGNEHLAIDPDGRQTVGSLLQLCREFEEDRATPVWIAGPGETTHRVLLGLSLVAGCERVRLRTANIEEYLV